MNLTIQRRKGKFATPGLVDIGIPIHTLERAPDDAIPCVLAGTYELHLHDSPTHPRVFALVNPALGIYAHKEDIPPGVDGHCEVLFFHAGSYETNSLKCILGGLAASEGVNPTTGRVESIALHTVDAVKELHARVPWVPGHTLTIIDP